MRGMSRQIQERLREQLEQKRRDLTARLTRIHDNAQRGLDADSAERAKQLEDSDVIDTLGKEARLELLQIAATLRRMDDGQFGTCIACGVSIGDARLEAYPYAAECIDCARRGDA
jgi:RNA polymerase-binding protein DksA